MRPAPPRRVFCAGAEPLAPVGEDPAPDQCPRGNPGPYRYAVQLGPRVPVTRPRARPLTQVRCRVHLLRPVCSNALGSGRSWWVPRIQTRETWNRSALRRSLWRGGCLPWRRNGKPLQRESCARLAGSVFRLPIVRVPELNGLLRARGVQLVATSRTKASPASRWTGLCPGDLHRQRGRGPAPRTAASDGRDSRDPAGGARRIAERGRGREHCAV